jgi:membrane protease YdiL (CAAX protease family)
MGVQKIYFLKTHSTEILFISIAAIAYFFSLWIIGISSALLLLIVVPICAYSFLAFKENKAKQSNGKDNVANLAWWALYIILVLLTAANIVPLVNELLNWLWIVIIPLIIVKFSNKASAKETLAIVGLCGPAIRQPWKKKTLAICLIISPFLIWSAHSRFNITFKMAIESPATLMFFPLMFILMMLTAGATEEVFFRGIIQRNLYNASKSQAIAVIVSALLFAIFHFPWAYFLWPHTQGNLLLSCATIMTEQFITGLFLGIVFVRSSNLWTSIILHSFINSVWATATFFTDSPILRFG